MTGGAVRGPVCPFTASRLMDGARLEHTADHVHLELRPPRVVLSSAVLNGGLLEADHVLNLAVPLRVQSRAEAPETTLQRYCEHQGWHGTTVGMMTAAPMESLRLVEMQEQGVSIAVLVTCGLSNARRVGDPADRRSPSPDGPACATVDEVGTINTVVVTSARLTPAAMAETLMIATEAKAAALQDARWRSPVSGLIATGTGTDAVAVVAGLGPGTVRWAGKHVVFGEMVGNGVMAALASSIDHQEPESARPPASLSQPGGRAEAEDDGLGGLR